HPEAGDDRRARRTSLAPGGADDPDGARRAPVRGARRSRRRNRRAGTRTHGVGGEAAGAFDGRCGHRSELEGRQELTPHARGLPPATSILLATPFFSNI